MHQHLDIGVIEKVHIVNLNEHIGTARGSQDQPADRADHLMASQRTRQRAGGCGQRREQRQHRQRRRTHPVEHTAVSEDQAFSDRRHRRIGVAGLRRVNPHHRPAARLGACAKFAA